MAYEISKEGLKELQVTENDKKFSRKQQALIVAWQRTSNADLGTIPLAPWNQSAHVAS